MPSTIHLYLGSDLTTCLAMQPMPEIMPHDEMVILPSSLSRRDRAAAELRTWLRTHDVASHLLVPESLVASTFGRRGSEWTRLDAGPGVEPIPLPRRLSEAGLVWTISDIDEIGGRGPYVLDLPARYSNLTTRLRLLGSRHRAELAVSLLRARPLDLHLIVRRFPAFTLLATTTDPIAAELLSLSLVDEELPGDQQVIGPWEDDFVQRAAEIELGARLPAEIRVVIHGHRHPAIDAMIGRVVARMGIDVGEMMSSDRER